MSVEAEARRQCALLQALRREAGSALAAHGPETAGLCEAAGLRERGARLRLGLGAYRAHAAATAERALAAAYPTVAAMVGEEALAGLAWALWQASPPRLGDLAQWGLDLPQFIESRPELEPWPFLADAARLDAAVLRCESAADAETALRAAGFSNVRVVGSEVGRASAIKMIRSVMVKGIEALSDEMMQAAEAAGVAAEVLSSLDASEKQRPWAERAAYNLERMHTHGLRRAAEMEESAKTLLSLGVEPAMTRGTIQRQREAAGKGKSQ